MTVGSLPYALPEGRQEKWGHRPASFQMGIDTSFPASGQEQPVVSDDSRKSKLNFYPGIDYLGPSNTKGALNPGTAKGAI
jgi:hypothetical protein